MAESNRTAGYSSCLDLTHVRRMGAELGTAQHLFTRTAPIFVLKAQPKQSNVTRFACQPSLLLFGYTFIRSSTPFKFADYDFQISPDGLVKLEST